MQIPLVLTYQRMVRSRPMTVLPERCPSCGREMVYVRTDPASSKIDHLAALIGQTGTDVWRCKSHGDFQVSTVGRVTLMDAPRQPPH
jgi:hypothetical protein